MTTHVTSSLGWLAALALLGAACTTHSLPVRYPSQAPAGTSREQLDKDEGACVAVASKAQTERAWAYIGCMVSRGYSTGVAFHVHASETLIAVTQTKPHEPVAIVSEVEGCRKTAYAAGRAKGGDRDAIVDQMEVTFRECLVPLGYTAQRQAPPARR